MALTAEQFYGESEAWNGGQTKAISWNDKRVISHYYIGGPQPRTFALPQAGTRPDRFQGGCWFVLVRPPEQTNTTNIVEGVNILASLTTAGTYCKMWLGPNGWIAGPIRTIGQSRPVNEGASTPLVAPEPEPFTPFCYAGDDPCLRLVDNGMVPLNGENPWPVGSETAPTVIVPFFQDPHIALNSEREAIRAADVVMPSMLAVQFHRDEWEIDENHPKFVSGAKTELSDAFWETLFNGDSWHELSYDAENSYHGDSSHWHHIRRVQSSPSDAWRMGPSGGATAVPVRRHVWRKTVAYGETFVAGTYPAIFAAQHEMEIRVVVEHTVDPEPTLEPDGTGGVADKTQGAYGLLVHVYVFTTELGWNFESPGGVGGWVLEDPEYTPVGAGGDILFDMDDPCMTGALAGDGFDDKYCHPWMVICAHLPTTFQSPIGKNWVPIAERANILGQVWSEGRRGRNREYCYTVSNGAPWSTCETGQMTLSDGAGRYGNIVFKSADGATTDNHAAITLGGDVPESQFVEFVTIENGLGEGRTFLKPFKAGWDEACGELDILGGSSISIKICVGDRFNEGGWPKFEIDTCEGHPDEPMEGIGGTHRCFHNDGSGATLPGFCCIEIWGSGALSGAPRLAKAYAWDRCTTDWVLFDEFCEIVDDHCDGQGKAYSGNMRFLAIEDYRYPFNPNLRTISWLSVSQNPEYVAEDYEYDAGDVGDFTQEIGTWAFGASISVTTAPGAGNVKAHLEYAPTSHTYEDIVVEAGITSASQRASVGVRCSTNGSAEVSGYFAEVQPFPGGDGEPNVWSLRIIKITDDVVEPLTDDESHISFTGEIHVSFECWGTRLTAIFTDTLSGEEIVTLEVDNCDFVTGNPAAMLRSGNITGVSWAEFTVEDKTRDFIEVEASLGRDSASLSFPAVLHRFISGFECNWSTPLSVCDGYGETKCECWYGEQQAHGSTSTSHPAGTGDITPTVNDPVTGACTEGDNPTWHDGPPPPCCEYISCSSGGVETYGCDIHCVPHPFRDLGLELPQVWTEPGRALLSPKLCRGIDHWNYPIVVCD